MLKCCYNIIFIYVIEIMNSNYGRLDKLVQAMMHIVGYLEVSLESTAHGLSVDVSVKR